jgi:ribosomal protein S3AE
MEEPKRRNAIRKRDTVIFDKRDIYKYDNYVLGHKKVQNHPSNFSQRKKLNIKRVLSKFSRHDSKEANYTQDIKKLKTKNYFTGLN